jgi:hypothetical protein
MGEQERLLRQAQRSSMERLEVQADGDPETYAEEVYRFWKGH